MTKYNLWIYEKQGSRQWWIVTKDEYIELCEKRLKQLLNMGSHGGYRACIFKIAKVGDESWIQNISDNIYK